MNEFLYQLGWIMKGYELLILLWFLVTQLPKHGWSLFYARGKSLSSLQLHEMHSCFMTVSFFTIFHVFGSELEQHLLTVMFSLGDKIKLFYLVNISLQFTFMLVLFLIHRFRGCLFSWTSRLCFYSTFAHMTLAMIELLARGYFDYHNIKFLYTVGVWVCNFAMVFAFAIYPIRQTLAYFKQRTEAA